MTASEDTYLRLIEWWRQTWWGMPEADELLPLLKTHLSPEEATLLTGIPFQGRTLEQLADSKRMDPAELGPLLDALASKGLLFRRS